MSESYFAPTIIRMLDAAFAAGTKTPKIRLQTPAGQDILIYRAGPRAGGGKFEGSGSITDGLPYGESTFFGRVDRDGQIRQPRKDGAEAVAQAIVAFDRQPEAVALMYAALRSECCFCAQELTDPRSDPNQGGAGYGPTCAKKYGLPWGEIRELDLTGLEEALTEDGIAFIPAPMGLTPQEDLSACETTCYCEEYAPADDLTERLAKAVVEGEERGRLDENEKLADRIVLEVLGATDSTASIRQFADALRTVKEILDARL